MIAPNSRNGNYICHPLGTNKEVNADAVTKYNDAPPPCMSRCYRIAPHRVHSVHIIAVAMMYEYFTFGIRN